MRASVDQRIANQDSGLVLSESSSFVFEVFNCLARFLRSPERMFIPLMIALSLALIPKSTTAKSILRERSSKNMISPKALRPPMNQGAMSVIGCICNRNDIIDGFYPFVASPETLSDI